MKQITTTQSMNIRKQYDENLRRWVFSVVDVIGFLTDSSDPRNYWKVLKNRLKKEHSELVTMCNQLKLPAQDGKLYLTDVGDAQFILEICRMVAPDKFDEVENFLSNFRDNSDLKEEDAEYELLIDGYIKDEVIHIESMLAGVDPVDIHVSVSPTEVEIIGKRKNILNKKNVEMDIDELTFGTFIRKLSLPQDVDIDQAELEFSNGLLHLEVPTIKKNRKRVLKIKNTR